MTRRVDCSYTISDDRLRAYARIPLIERLRWLDELCRFTLAWRAAPVAPGSAYEPDPEPDPGQNRPAW